MANQKTKRMDKAIRAEMMRLLRERVNNPTLHWLRSRVKSDDELFAGQLLKDAGYFAGDGRITIAGMDYYRRETMQFRWARENWFPAFVAVLTAGATLGAGILTIWFGNRPC